MDLRNSNGFQLRRYFGVKELFRKFSSEVEKMWNSVQVLPNRLSKKSSYTFEDIDLQESHAKLHEKPIETLGVV